MKAQTLWQVEIPGAGVKFRCLSKSGGLVVQQHDGKKWADMSMVGIEVDKDKPGNLLLRLANGLAANLNEKPEKA